MKKYECDTCGYVYDPAVGDPDGGIAPGTAFEDIPDDWVCPLCGVSKDDFSVVEEFLKILKLINLWEVRGFLPRAFCVFYSHLQRYSTLFALLS